MSGRRNRVRVRLWKENPRCFWCGKKTLLDAPVNQRNAATLDHLYSRLHPSRTNNGLLLVVLTCLQCNRARADYENKGAYFMPRLKERIEIARQTCATLARKNNEKLVEAKEDAN